MCKKKEVVQAMAVVLALGMCTTGLTGMWK